MERTPDCGPGVRILVPHAPGPFPADPLPFGPRAFIETVSVPDPVLPHVRPDAAPV